VLYFARFRFAILAAAACMCLCASLYGQTADTWTSIKTKNLTLIGNASPHQMRSAAERLEQFRWAFAQLYPNLKLDNGKPTQIVMFRDAAAYFEFLPRRPDGSADVGVAGYYQAGEDRNYITFAVSERQTDPLSTAVHEFVHSLIDANFDRDEIPPWLTEGLAEYFETTRIDSKKIIIGEQHVEHLRLLRRSSMIPLTEFLEINAADLKTMSQEKRRLYYAESWAVVATLMNKGEIAVDRLKEVPPRPVDLDGAEFNRFARGDLERPMVVNVAERMPAIDPGSPQPVTAARVSATLGDLLLHTGEFARSEVYLRKSLADDPSDVTASASLGLVLLRQGNINEARPFLQKALNAGSTEPQILTSYAVTLIEPLAKGAREIDDKTAAEIRSILKRSIDLNAAYADSYRLSALLNFLRDERLDEAITLLTKAISLKPEDAEAQILLARIFLRREDAERARDMAAKLTSSQTDAKRRAEAAEIVSNANEYLKAKAETVPASDRLDVRLAEWPTLVVLKRSWLTEADVAQIDAERINNNFNRIILHTAVGEQQMVGRIDSIRCSGQEITYSVTPRNGPKVVFTSLDFVSIRMTVAKEGESSFQIGCDISLSTELAVINFRPATSTIGTAKATGELTAISFVPENFRLKSPAEMNSARPVAVDNDTIRRTGPAAEVNVESINRSISQSLRHLQKGELRISGTIDKVDCSSGTPIFQISSDGKTLKLIPVARSRPEVGWFTVASSQLPLSCGSGPLTSPTLISYVAERRDDGADGTIRAIEFVPYGFVP